jgi:tetratricopeptide (TPR) repeat protein
VAIVLGGLLVAAYLRLTQTKPAPTVQPPELNIHGADPAIIEAVEKARAKVLESPNSSAAWGKLGMILVVHDFKAEGYICLAEAERLDPREPRWPYYQALGMLVGADPQSALPKLQRAVELSGDAYDAPRLRLAELFFSQNRLDEAEEQFRYLLAKDPRNPRAQLGMARVLMQHGNLQACLGPLEIARKDGRTRKEAHALLAQIQQQLGNHTAAEEARRVVAALPDDPMWNDPLNDEAMELLTGKENWVRRARRLSELGRDREALDLLRNTIAAYPDADDAWAQLGKTLLKLKNVPLAEAAFRKATQLRPDKHENVYLLGYALVIEGKMPEAIACYRKATEVKPDFAPAWHDLGSALAQNGDRAGAIEAYRIALRYDPNYFGGHLNLAIQLAAKNQWAEALLHAQFARMLMPSDMQAAKLEEELVRKLPLPLAIP